MVDKDRQKVLQALALVSTIGFEMATCVVLGFFAGRFLDQKMGTDPWLMLGGVICGVVVGMIGIYTLVTSFWKE
ncbi:AtpZ/AtpI family protein [Candidatus Formimonas warabiya]|uniref:AtpZ/AtpI family protein n=1 Tax=Formimonas warabiya TaxID=1761012 RepID=A0A3G1KTZ7_FORW1|nr:AtpZ/AtpI family protein [Candidatus Formimonas warabiya]ATW25983.1 hypothetical protein DCMF_15430 [Candidatus Formimonas warabiya]